MIRVQLRPCVARFSAKRRHYCHEHDHMQTQKLSRRQRRPTSQISPSIPQMCIARRYCCPGGHATYEVLEQCYRANIKWHNADKKMCMGASTTKFIDVPAVCNNELEGVEGMTSFKHPECAKGACRPLFRDPHGTARRYSNPQRLGSTSFVSIRGLVMSLESTAASSEA